MTNSEPEHLNLQLCKTGSTAKIKNIDPHVRMVLSTLKVSLSTAVCTRRFNPYDCRCKVGSSKSRGECFLRYRGRRRDNARVLKRAPEKTDDDTLREMEIVA
jgi:hypothetical protein